MWGVMSALQALYRGVWDVQGLCRDLLKVLMGESMENMEHVQGSIRVDLGALWKERPHEVYMGKNI